MIRKHRYKKHKRKKKIPLSPIIEELEVEDNNEEQTEESQSWNKSTNIIIVKADVHRSYNELDFSKEIDKKGTHVEEPAINKHNADLRRSDYPKFGPTTYVIKPRGINEQFGNTLCNISVAARPVYKREIFQDDYEQYVNPYPESYEPIESPPSPAPSGRDFNVKPAAYYIILPVVEADSDTSVFDDELESPKSNLVNMTELVEEDRKLIIEFCHLLDKAKQLFNGLRELPQYGHKQWHLCFARTFDVYTKLWKFQQQHRAVLDTKYGLKRWQIGEIASKIGQLYYHFYLRTSECAYLNEAFAFYHAIRGRSYYTKACTEDKCELIVKKLRYYARFIVVCLLLRKIKLVRELIKELERQIAEYGNTYDPDDQIEWTLVVDEVKAFIQAEQVVTILHPDNYAVILSHRLTPDTVPAIERSPQMVYNLQEAMIIGNRKYQVKFSELAIDMFRIIQTLERDPLENAQHIYDESPRRHFASIPNAPTTKGYLEETSRRESANPHKILLYKPAVNQALVYTGSGILDLLPNGALLFYISADGYTCPTLRSSEPGYDMGGVITTSKADVYREGRDQKSQTKYKEVQCIYPGDLYQFNRAPMFLIIDSDNSFAFANMPKIFGYPHVTFMSPIEIPGPYHDHKHQGSLFTLFLHAPLVAFCYICEIRNTTLVHWERALVFVDNFLIDALNILLRNRPDLNYIAFIGDDFLRLLILRYIFCDTTLRLHRAFRTRNTLPRCSPCLPEELTDHPALTGIITDIANHFQVRNQFDDIGAAGPAPKD